MDSDFKVLERIKNAIIENNTKIKENINLANLYLGFCEHLFSYLDAYEALFGAHNYYACRAIMRIMLDLYIKVRLFAEVEDSEDFADWILRGNCIKKYMNFPKIKNLTDINLCKYFDEQDNHDKNWANSYENLYREMSSFVHPGKQGTLEYWKKHDWFEQKKTMYDDVEESDKVSFEHLSTQVHIQLTKILCKVLNKQTESITNGKK